MMYFDVRVDETLRIGDVLVTVMRKTGQRARLRVEADKNVVVSLQTTTPLNTDVRINATLSGD